jgi:hypothetical protein
MSKGGLDVFNYRHSQGSSVGFWLKQSICRRCDRGIEGSAKVQVGEMFVPNVILSLKCIDATHRYEEAVPPSSYSIPHPPGLFTGDSLL